MSDNEWRRLALQFDGHRMQAIGHLKAMLQDPQAHREAAEKFLSAGPLSGEEVLAERIKAIAAAAPDADRKLTMSKFATRADLEAARAKMQADSVQAPKCECSFRIKMVGDGCHVCNPKMAAEIEADNLADECAAFEAYYKPSTRQKWHYKDGRYMSPDIQARWEAWQARANVK